MSALQEQARALGDPTRHRILRYVADAGRPVGVAELAEQVALNHNAVRRHLAKLMARAADGVAVDAATVRRDAMVHDGFDPVVEDTPDGAEVLDLVGLDPRQAFCRLRVAIDHP